MVLLNLILGLSPDLKEKGKFSGKSKVRLDSKISDFQFLFLKELFNLKSSKVEFLGEKKKQNFPGKITNFGFRTICLETKEVKGKFEKGRKGDIEFNLVPFYDSIDENLVTLTKSDIILFHSKENEINETFNLNFQGKHELPFPSIFRGNQESKRASWGPRSPKDLKYQGRKLATRILQGLKREVILQSFPGSPLLKVDFQSLQLREKFLKKIFLNLDKKEEKGQVSNSIKSQSTFSTLSASALVELVGSRMIDDADKLKNSLKADIKFKEKKDLSKFFSLGKKITFRKVINTKSTQVSIGRQKSNNDSRFFYKSDRIELNSNDKLEFKEAVSNRNQNDKDGVSLGLSKFVSNFKQKDNVSLLKGKEFYEISSLSLKKRIVVSSQDVRISEGILNNRIPFHQEVKGRLELGSRKERVQASKLKGVKSKKSLVNVKLASKQFSKVEDQVIQNQNGNGNDSNNTVNSELVNTGTFVTKVNSESQIFEIKAEIGSHHRENGKAISPLLSPQEQGNQSSYDFQDGSSSSNNFENSKKEFSVPRHINNNFQNFVIRNEDVSMRLSFNRAGVLNLSLKLAESYILEPSLIEDIRSIIRTSGFTPGKVYLKVKSKGEVKERTTELKV